MTGARYPEFAEKLKSARRRSGKSQERIAAEVGTSRRHWIRWERGEHLPSGEFMARIGEAVGQPEEFADDDDEEAASLMPLAADTIIETLSEALDALKEKRAELADLLKVQT